MMLHAVSRRRFLQVSAACAATALVAKESLAQKPSSAGKLIINDDGFVFLLTSDDLRTDDLRHYLQSYCRPGVETVAFCVGDMSWPTFYASKVGQSYAAKSRIPDDLKRWRIYQNLDHFASAEPGGYFGATFRILHELGKKVLASFRMNDAHYASPNDPNVSEFWKQHSNLTLGQDYGYYSGCFNYAHDVVRQHFIARVLEFAELYPDIDGIDLDAMRSPYFFPPGKGPEHAGLFTDLVRQIKAGLAAQAKRLNRPEYLLTINVPFSPELALETGLDVAAWDAEKLFNAVSFGAYQTYMDTPIAAWKKLLVQGTPLYGYINCSAQDGQYLSLEQYRAAAANAYGAGADGVCLFNYPCLFELSFQQTSPIEEVRMALPDLRNRGHQDFSKIGQMLDEVGSVEKLRRKDKHYLFYFNPSAGYRHWAPVLPGLDRHDAQGSLKAAFHCYEECDHARSITLRFKIENLLRSERFRATLNGQELDPGKGEYRYAPYGRDTRTHSINRGPFQEYAISLRPNQLNSAENVLDIKPTRLIPELTSKLNLFEIELLVSYGEA